MAELRFELTGWRGAPSAFRQRCLRALGYASRRSVDQVMQKVLDEGRANIRGAGFSQTWQQGLKSDVYPKGRERSIGTKGFLKHQNNLAVVFEFGKTIEPKRRSLLWLPMPDTPTSGLKTKSGHGPAAYAGVYGPLGYMNGSGGKPFLYLLADPTRKPLYVGVNSVTIQKKWNVLGIAQKEFASFSELFNQNLSKAAREQGLK